MNKVSDRIAHHLRTRLKISHLVMLEAIEREGSIHKAASARGVSQPGVTKSLKALEAAVGCPLFERTSTGLKATAVGKEMIEIARGMLRDIDRTAVQIASVAEGRKGLLRIGSIPYISEEPLIYSAKHLIAERHTQISFMTGSSPDLAAALMERKLDCAILRYVDVEGSSKLKFEELYWQKAALVFRKGSFDHDAIAEDVWKRRDLTWILPPKQTPTRVAINLVFVAKGLPPPQSDFECMGVRLTSRLIQESPNSITIFPLDVARDICGDKLEYVECREHFTLPPICFVTNLTSVENPLTSTWRRYLFDAIANVNAVFSPRP